MSGTSGPGGPDTFFTRTPLDPPPIPLHKPRLPDWAALQATPVSRAAPVSQAITTESLSPIKSIPATRPALAVASYRVAAGDTVYAVARRFAVPLRSVIDANRLRPPYGLRVGRQLTIPEPRRHQVAKGDTVFAISRRYGVELSQLVRLNRIAPPYAIAPGKTLTLPVSGRVAQQAALTPGTLSAPAKTRARLLPIPNPPPRAGSKFLWPVRGKLITRYGPRKGGAYNDGINIAAPRGAPVQAADNGVVAYVGNELRGFGNLILLKHAGGWITAYAHTEGAAVKRGQKVKRGQTIARIGSSGNVSRPQLHFEIRKGTRAVNPTGLLGPQRAAAG